MTAIRTAAIACAAAVFLGACASSPGFRYEMPVAGMSAVRIKTTIKLVAWLLLMVFPLFGFVPNPSS